VWAETMRDWPKAIGWPNVNKAELRAAVDATDTWIEDNQSSYNTALPQPFRNRATVAQKTFVFCYVALRRAGLLRAEGE
jgi:hypothetical protein